GQDLRSGVGNRAPALGRRARAVRDGLGPSARRTADSDVRGPGAGAPAARPRSLPAAGYGHVPAPLRGDEREALPVLHAAHIRPVSEGGRHLVTNGLLLRSDVHALFDRGYV